MSVPDGIEVCSRILNQSGVPIIFLTALVSNDNVVRGLESSALDYVTKPLSPEVLVARVRSALRQAAPMPQTERGTVYENGYLTIDARKRTVLVRGGRVRLTPMEYRLLFYLLQNAERLVRYEDVLEHVWRLQHRDRRGSVHVLISRSRSKLERDPTGPEYFHNERSVGYRFTTSAAG